MRANDHTGSPWARKGWIAAAVIVDAALFWLATSDVVYELTSPPEFSFHVAFRKAYSIVAFAVVGFTLDKALGPSTRPLFRSALLVGAYSLLIEIAQHWRGSHEGLKWNVIDTLCGVIGGWIGASASVVASRIIRTRRRA